MVFAEYAAFRYPVPMHNRQRRTRLLEFYAVLFLFAVVCCFVTATRAQQSASGQKPPDAPSATQSANTARRQTPQVAFFTTLQRKSLVFPDIATTEGPISTGEKFKLFVDNSFSISTLFTTTVGSGIAQATNSPEGYRQGGDAYAKRFGSSMARNASSNFFGTFLLASALHQDPRFFPQRDPTFGGSVKYSVRRLFVTRDDSGGDIANWSGLLGPLFAEGLANTYWPQRERTAGDTFQRYGLDLATNVGGNMFRNYWPVFFKKLRGSTASHSSAR